MSLSMDDRDGFIWLDGKLVPWRASRLHVLTHALHYGTGCFEGVRAYWNPNQQQLFALLVKPHFKRLRNCAKRPGSIIRSFF